jgi:hypothetical protein
MDKYKPSAPRGVFAVATVPLAASVALADPAPEGCSAIIPEPLFPEVRGARLNLTPSHVQSWEQLHSLCVTRGIPAARQRDSATFQKLHRKLLRHIHSHCTSAWHESLARYWTCDRSGERRWNWLGWSRSRVSCPRSCKVVRHFMIVIVVASRIGVTKNLHTYFFRCNS